MIAAVLFLRAVPQMADTKEVIGQLSLEGSRTKLLVIVANTRGAEEALKHSNITYVGFPFSISPAFQLRNTNSTIEDSVQRVEDIQNICIKHNKHLVVYLSMAFGNPYDDKYDEEILLHWADEMVKRNIEIISLADTIGAALPEQIYIALNTLIHSYPQTVFGVHLHSCTKGWEQKVEAALQAGCKRFDGTLKGIGGCPLADSELVGNMNMELMIDYFKRQKILKPLDEEALQVSLQLAKEIFE